MTADGADFARDRIDYGPPGLARADLPAEPFALFARWLDEARAAGVSEPNAMALASVDAAGQPHCRIVLLKHCDGRGLAFFTNRDSDKGRQLAANPRAAATFWWSAPRNRQVRFVGTVEDVDGGAADRYFGERPRRAQLASAASPQSRVIADRAELERRIDALAATVGAGPVPRPPHWGGYALVAHAVEFWQGSDDRMHDRYRYTRAGDGWETVRLAP
ncbi:MAG: pyridoxamine 5'-phosphate oxidase [Planctomycetota bacterium]